MQEITFQDIPQQYENMIKHIRADVLTNVYSKFDYLYFDYSLYIKTLKNADSNDLNEKISLINQYFLDYLKDAHFLTYQILLNSKDSINNGANEQRTSSIICIEGKCFIIENIFLSSIAKVINDLDKQGKSILNVSSFQHFPEEMNEKEEEKEAKIEVSNFCKFFNSEKSIC